MLSDDVHIPLVLSQNLATFRPTEQISVKTNKGCPFHFSVCMITYTVHVAHIHYTIYYFSLEPRPPLQPSKGKRGSLVNIVQHFCTSEEFRRHNLIGSCANYLTYTGLSYHKPLSFTGHTLQTYSAHHQFAEPMQQATSKA